MKENIIGDKRRFGIEYSILMVDPSPPYGDCRLWIGGNFLGGIEGEVYLTRVCHLLEGILSIKNELFLEDDFYNLSDVKLFDLMQKDEIDEKGKCWFMDTEGFDLFRNYVYRRDEMLHFLWQLAPQVREKYELQGFPTRLFSAQVAVSMYEEVVKQFRSVIMTL